MRPQTKDPDGSAGADRDMPTDLLIAGSYYATLTLDALSSLDGFDPDTDALIAAGVRLVAYGSDDATAFAAAA